MHQFIKESALSVGFDACGIAKAEKAADDADFMKKWLSDGFQGEMQYLSRNFEKRTDPRALVPACKSVITVLLNYFPEKLQKASAPQIAKYAYSAIDYHYLIKKMLSELEALICKKYGDDIVSKDYQHSFVDSAPVLERRWAERAGLGWIGKNTQLIAPQTGSYCFIGILMINAETVYDQTIKNRCGNCTKCIDSCPTKALSRPYNLNANKCISYLTIEKKGEIPSEYYPNLSNCLFGCDICADVCPWNKKWAKAHNHPELSPADFLTWDSDKWQNLSEQEFDNTFNLSAVKRAGYKKIRQNFEALSD